MTRDLQFAMPSAVGAEKTILGAIMLDNKMFYEAAEQIDIEDFYLDAHRRIFACMAAVVEDQKAIDIITVTDRLEKRGEVNAVGGVAYVSSLIDGVPHIDDPLLAANKEARKNYGGWEELESVRARLRQQHQENVATVEVSVLGTTYRRAAQVGPESWRAYSWTSV